MSNERYIPQVKDRPQAEWITLGAEPTYRQASEAAGAWLGSKDIHAVMGTDGELTFEQVNVRILLNEHAVDLGDRDIVLALMAYDPVLKAFFEFGRHGGGQGLAELDYGPTAALQQRVLAGTVTTKAQQSERDRLAAAAGKISALHDFVALMRLALQAMVTNVNADASEPISEEGLDMLVADATMQARTMLEALGCTEDELDAAGITTEALHG